MAFVVLSSRPFHASLELGPTRAMLLANCCRAMTKAIRD